MSNTADVSNFSTSSPERSRSGSGLAGLWRWLARAAERRAIHRIELEAGHLLDEKQLREIRRQFLLRHGERV